jgi:hypothetical protein
MLRFADPLLDNPVIWSDEQLAQTETGKAIPERYRESISEKVQQVECKGIKALPLHSAVRHVISVNDVDKVFSSEVDQTSVEATMERFLVVDVDGDAVDAFERKWAGTVELDQAREGGLILEHVRWIEKNKSFVSEGRLFVDTKTDQSVLMAARFSDEFLILCVEICLDAIVGELRLSNPGSNPDRLPMFLDPSDNIRISPSVISQLWNDAKATKGTGYRKPSAQKVGKCLSKAGFKKQKKERASKSKYNAWIADEKTLLAFLETHGLCEVEKVIADMVTIKNHGAK